MELNKKKKSAKSVSLFVFIFMVLVSAVIYIKSDTLDMVSYLLIMGAPFVMFTFFYLVVLHHDPNAND